jgi:hypothetical protein
MLLVRRIDACREAHNGPERSRQVALWYGTESRAKRFLEKGFEDARSFVDVLIPSLKTATEMRTGGKGVKWRARDRFGASLRCEALAGHVSEKAEPADLAPSPGRFSTDKIDKILHPKCN